MRKEHSTHTHEGERVSGVEPRFLRDGHVPGVGKEALRTPSARPPRPPPLLLPY